MKREIESLFTAVLVFGVVCVAIGAKPRAVHKPSYALTDVRVHDADTIIADIHLGFGVVLDNERIRLTGFDAWEINRVRRTVKITDEEIVKGVAARNALVRLLKLGEPRLLQGKDKRGAYGRIEARLIIVTDTEIIDVAEFMKDHGHERTVDVR